MKLVQRARFGISCRVYSSLFVILCFFLAVRGTEKMWGSELLCSTSGSFSHTSGSRTPPCTQRFRAAAAAHHVRQLVVGMEELGRSKTRSADLFGEGGCSTLRLPSKDAWTPSCRQRRAGRTWPSDSDADPRPSRACY